MREFATRSSKRGLEGSAAKGDTLISSDVQNAVLFDRLVPTLHEDARIVAVAKPAGVDVGGAPGRGSSGLSELLGKVRDRGETLLPVNRLSRHESGILLLAKDAETVRELRGALKSNRIALEYIAVVLGRMPRKEIALSPVSGSSRGRRQTGRSGRKGARDPGRRRSGDSNAGTTTVLTAMRTGERRTLVRCRTTVANTHILRAQLRSLKLRLVGDQLRQSVPHKGKDEDTCLHLSKVTLERGPTGKPTIIRSHHPEAFGSALRGEKNLERTLLAALSRRLACLAEPDTDAYRLITGSAEGIRGLAAERYGKIVVLQIHEDAGASTKDLRRIARWYRDLLEISSVYLKRFVRSRNRTDEDLEQSLHSPEPFFGETAPPKIEIIERGVRFMIRPYGGFSVGLFLDQRENRTRVREIAEGKDVLNLFAYTCGFSVVAAAGGAKSTVSVDISPKHLEWGRENFDVNGLDLANHMFIRSDAADYLKRAKRQKKRFDLIVLDPPSFAHDRKTNRKFSVLSDLAELVAGAVELLRPNGSLMISTNHRRLSARGLHDRLAEGAGGERHRITATPPLPVDFAGDPNHAKTIIARFGR